jgi:Predicted membrane-associated Zn-dependent proteases 1
MEIIVNIITVGAVLGLLVFIHEFGHYAAAKLCGVRVEVFSIGFGSVCSVSNAMRLITASAFFRSADT